MQQIKGGIKLNLLQFSICLNKIKKIECLLQDVYLVRSESNAIEFPAPLILVGVGSDHLEQVGEL